MLKFALMVLLREDYSMIMRNERNINNFVEAIGVLEAIQLISICQTHKIEHFEVWKKLQFILENLY